MVYIFYSHLRKFREMKRTGYQNIYRTVVPRIEVYLCLYLGLIIIVPHFGDNFNQPQAVLNIFLPVVQVIEDYIHKCL